MLRIPDDKVEQALDILGDDSAAKARAAHEYLDSLTKTVLAKLSKDSNAKSATDRESEARSRPEFVQHLQAVRNAAELDYAGRQKIDAARAIFEAYRTQSANDRQAHNLR